jgi:hypothetical protein
MGPCRVSCCGEKEKAQRLSGINNASDRYKISPLTPQTLSLAIALPNNVVLNKSSIGDQKGSNECGGNSNWRRRFVMHSYTKTSLLSFRSQYPPTFTLSWMSSLSRNPDAFFVVAFSLSRIYSPALIGFHLLVSPSFRHVGSVSTIVS